MSPEKRAPSTTGADTGFFIRRGAVSRLPSIPESAPLSAPTPAVHPTCPSQHSVHAFCCFCSAQSDPLRSNPVISSFATALDDSPLSYMSLTVIHPVTAPVTLCSDHPVFHLRFGSPFTSTASRKTRHPKNFSHKFTPVGSSAPGYPRRFSEWVASSKSVLGKRAAKRSLKNPHILALIAESAQERAPITLACEIESVAPEFGFTSAV